jgi:radical SAM superfamily enzyme YgiQ (UPF0313 family)
MKTSLVAINSKYIHPNLAIRYLKANTDYPVDMIELTIKDDEEKIIKTILETQPNIVGFSVYIWNVEIIKPILRKLRTNHPDIIIILGGPEVSYQNDTYFRENLTDYIITGEGEKSFDLLLDAIHQKKTDYSSIPNLIYIRKGMIIKNKGKNIEDLRTLKDPYHVIKEKDIQHKIQYVELSRGCPYQCAYCLASLEKGLRFFDINHVLEIIDDLIKKGARTFKFLDRSFNANHRLAQDFLKKLYQKHYQDVVFQFEINGDVLKDNFIDFLIEETPKDLVRFEIGVQSTNDLVNKAVHRYQDTQQLIKNIHKLKQAPIVLHLDLIAGLPYEDLESFKNTFNTIYQLFPDELQLGFLKVLKGTAIERQSAKYKIQYQKQAPYEIIDNAYISAEELQIIHKVETMLNIYWNKNFMNQSIKHLTEDMNAFDFFLALYDYFKKNNYPTLRYHFNDLFTHLIGYLKANHLFDHKIDSLLKYDFLIHHPIKPKLYWDNSVDKNTIIRLFHKENPQLNIDDLYKYAVVTDYLDGYLIVTYQPKSKDIYIYNPS